MFRIERKRVPKPVAERKHWGKFGDAADDVEGPDPATTKIADEVFLTLTTNSNVRAFVVWHLCSPLCTCDGVVVSCSHQCGCVRRLPYSSCDMLSCDLAMHRSWSSKMMTP